MNPQVLLQDAAADLQHSPAFALSTDRHRVALQELHNAFDKETPVAIMLGEGKHEFSHVIGAFLNSLNSRATVIHLRHSTGDALDAMREVSLALGFDPKDLSLGDLKNILTMFLEYQDKHQRRTILCIEQADERELWLLDCVADIVHSNRSRQGHLLVVLSGGPRLLDLANNAALSAIGKNAGRAIRLAPFTFAETREFIDQRSEALGLADIHTLFEFDAVDRLHKLSGGRPHTVAQLCQETLRLTERGKRGPVTAKMVLKTVRRLRRESSVDLAMAMVESSHGSDPASEREQLTIRRDGALVQTITISRGRFMVGRSKTADICLPSSMVSRRHALIIRTAESLQVLDIGSKNGTYVAGQRVRECTLEHGSTVVLGDFEIECTLPDQS